jgi:c-di-GMP-binding flagellar brake protein YcgR
MQTTEDERREYFRIRDRLLIEYRPVTAEESLILEKNLRLDFGVQSPHPFRLSELPANPPFIRDLYAYLESLERKLDRVIEMLSKAGATPRTEYLDVDISGAGIKFYSNARLEEGTYLELCIVLPSLPDLRILTLGKIIRMEQASKDRKEAWEIGVSFLAMREKERDLLINYIFSKERERRRAASGHGG